MSLSPSYAVHRARVLLRKNCGTRHGAGLVRQRGVKGQETVAGKDRHNHRQACSLIAKYNLLANLHLLTESENLSKNATPFEEWIKTRDVSFRRRHLIPEMTSYVFDAFDEFYEKRKAGIVAALKGLT